jgi:alpha-mannosidase
MGFAWVAAGSGEPQETPAPAAAKKRLWKKPKAPPPMAEENRLRNEFFEIAFDPTTGAIQAVHDYASRENKLAQQIAFRFPKSSRGRWADGDEEMAYSVMAADQVLIKSAGPLVAEMECRGRLLDREGRRGARFVQTTRVQRGNRVIELGIELDVGQEPGENPWDSYYAVRFAWGDSTADLFRGASQSVQPTDANQIEAPGFLELRSDKGRTTILTGGLPYHRRFGLRKLDTLLVVRGETARSFRLGIGIDLPNPVPAAIDFISPRPELEERSAAPSPPYGWLFHVDSRNVIATHWSPVFSGGRVSGFCTRLLETEGRRVQAGLRAFRPLTSARKTDLAGGHPEELPVDGDQVKIDLPPCGWVPIEVKFA